MKHNLILAALSCALAGCTLRQMERDLDADRQRVQAKEAALGSAQQQQAALETERKRLAAALEDQNLSAAALHEQLSRMQAGTRPAPGDSPELKQRKQQLGLKLQHYQSRLAALQQGGPTLAEKQQRLDRLKADIRQQLVFGLN